MKNPTNEGKVGYKHPPRHTQFGQPGGNPRHNGAWSKKDTARYKLQQMMKLTEEELKTIAEDIEAPLFERKLAIAINKGEWKHIESMINQVYGTPRQTVDNLNNGESFENQTNIVYINPADLSTSDLEKITTNSN